MTLLETTDLDEAMNAIKEEIMKDLSESVMLENHSYDKTKDFLELH